MIAAHHSMLAGGNPTAKTYRGIIADTWDGIENAGYGVHNASAIAWKDLVGGYDAAKAGSPTFSDNAGVTNGANNTFMATLPNSSRFIQAAKAGPVTVEVCLSTTLEWGSRCPFSILDSSGTSSTYRFLQVFMQTNQQYRASPYTVNGTSFLGTTPAQTSPNGTFAFVFGESGNSIFTIPYANGVAGTPGTSISSSIYFMPSTIDTLGVANWFVRIGRAHNNNMTASYHRVTLHAGELSAADLAYNAAVDKIRFGLT